MQKGDLVFVYGTLRHGESADISKKFEGIVPVGVDRINGQIFDVGWYPGLKPVSEDFDFLTGEPKVTGEVYIIPDEKAVSRLDEYEGYPALYGRREFETESGKTVWAYVYNRPVQYHDIVVSGDWKQREKD